MLFILSFIYDKFCFMEQKLDRPFVLTSRVKDFLAILLVVTFIMIALCLSSQSCTNMFIFAPLILTYAISTIMEKLFLSLLNIKQNKDFKV